jgi:NAD dependent epimerase/dehydratase family
MMINTLLIGGNSKLGLAIRSKADFIGNCVVRTPDSSQDCIYKPNYGQLTARDFSGYRQVINLIGTNQRDLTTLKTINVDLVHHLAREARTAGVENFINISSFSVFGSTQEIHLSSQPSPESDYGRSKLDAELILRQMSGKNFNVTNVRLPMLYGTSGSKLHMLLNIWSKIRYLPVPNLDAKRSMLHYDLAADALLSLEHISGYQNISFADPEAFQFELVAKTMSGCAKHRVSSFVVGKHTLAPLNWVMPSAYQSLYSSSYLTAAANGIEGTDLKSRLYQDIHDMATALYA